MQVFYSTKRHPKKIIIGLKILDAGIQKKLEGRITKYKA
jgi:hypothetical protein